MKKKIMMGNAAVARGLYEAGCRFVSSYPGTPSTEITECVADYEEIYAEWAPNEKVAVESTIGASIGGVRSFAAMKHVGLNVAADPIFTASYTGVSGGCVIAVADDMGMHSSQNEQDSRHYARASKIPMLEPSDSEECKEFIKAAYELSEKYDTLVFLRTSTRVAHSQSAVSLGERQERDIKPYEKNISKYVMMPAKARARHVVVEERECLLRELAETTELNRIEYNDRKIGIIASGIAYQYAREAFGDGASYLKLGLVYPLPVKKIEEFAANVDELFVIEELDDIFEAHCKKHGITVRGKELFSKLGEYSPALIRAAILGEKKDILSAEDAPVRPPVLCPGCPHRAIFHVFNKLKLTVSGDIGCYTLGAQPPLNAVDITLCMGASISGLHGMNKARGADFAKKSIAVIGDSTFIHSGITGLINAVYNQSPTTVVISDNSTTGMTGHQQNPATGLTLKNEPAPVLDLEAVCRAVGVKRVNVIDPYDLKAFEKLLREELEAPEPSVIIAKHPCALLKSVKRGAPYSVDAEKCIGCGMCMKIGCPSISLTEKVAKIDTSLCVGCGLCASMCAKGCICKD